MDLPHACLDIIQGQVADGFFKVAKVHGECGHRLGAAPGRRVAGSGLGDDGRYNVIALGAGRMKVVTVIVDVRLTKRLKGGDLRKEEDAICQVRLFSESAVYQNAGAV